MLMRNILLVRKKMSVATSTFRWTESYRVNIAVLDRQHQQLFDTVNELDQALHTGEGKSVVEAWPDASTVAAGLRVPRPYGDYLVLDILRQSKGTAVAVSDDEILKAVRDWASVEGIFAAPEGAASLAACAVRRS